MTSLVLHIRYRYLDVEDLGVEDLVLDIDEDLVLDIEDLTRAL